MMIRVGRAGLASMILIAGLAAAAAAQSAAPPTLRIGSAAVVRGRVEALSPESDAVGRVLGSGKPVYLHDRIKTDAHGYLQIILIDETVFTIGPNSSMELDELVYDPNTTPRLTVRLIEGVFRFITGKIAKRKPGSMKVTTPVSTIGIFGTIVEVRIKPDGESLILLMGPGAHNSAGEEAGHIQVYNESGRTEVRRSGFAVRVRAGSAPSRPFKLDSSLTPEFDALAVPAPTKKGTALSEKEGNDAILASGQDAASGAGWLSGADTTLAMGQNAGVFAQWSAQNSAKDNLFPDGQTTSWAVIQAMQGMAFYPTVVVAFVGTLPCAGGVVNCSDTWHGQFQLNLTTKSFVVANTSTGFFSPNISDLTGFGVAFSYANLRGPAILNIPTGCPGSTCVPGAGLYTWKWINVNNKPAAAMVGTLIYNDGTNSGIGVPVTNPRQ